MDKKKAAAAIAGVMNYIYEEAAVAASICPAAQEEVAVQKPPVSVKLWGLSGRQDIMQMSNLMQMRAFKGTRF
ncbi:conserved hypothetical protein [Candidatus Magnetomoraceae bacterium gMMP-15]